MLSPNLNESACYPKTDGSLLFLEVKGIFSLGFQNPQDGFFLLRKFAIYGLMNHDGIGAVCSETSKEPSRGI